MFKVIYLEYNLRGYICMYEFKKKNISISANYYWYYRIESKEKGTDNK